jgi:hypothetical protein
MGEDRIVEHRRRVVPFEQQRVVEEGRAGGEHRDRDHGDHDLRGVKLDRAPAEPQHDVPFGLLRAVRRSDHEPQRPAGEEHEQVGGIRQRIIRVREARVVHARHMIDEDRDERDPTPEIEGVGLAGHFLGLRAALTLCAGRRVWLTGMSATAAGSRHPDTYRWRMTRGTRLYYAGVHNGEMFRTVTRWH